MAAAPCQAGTPSLPQLSCSQTAILRDKIGQLLLTGFRGLEADDSAPIARDIRAGRVGGVVLFDRDLALGTAERNIRSPQQLKELVASLQARAAIPLWVAVDQEGGQVARLKEKHGFPASVSARNLGNVDRVELTLEHAERAATSMATCGINLNFAPLVDLDLNPENPIIGRYGRSYSADANVVVRHALAVIEGHRRHGVACCLKHFPGHGSSRQDSHLGFTDVSDSWHESELRPYRELIAGGQAEAIMTAHIFNSRLDRKFPATLSKKTIGRLLRREMHYAGIVISDDMEMKAISAEYSREKALELALNAGVDVILMANNLVYDPDIPARTQETILELVAARRVSAARIERAWRRVMAWKRSWLAISGK